MDEVSADISKKSEIRPEIPPSVPPIHESKEAPPRDMEIIWSNAFVVGKTLKILGDQPEIPDSEVEVNLKDPKSPHYVDIKDDKFASSFLSKVVKVRHAIDNISQNVKVSGIPTETAGEIVYNQFFPWRKLIGGCTVQFTPLAIELTLNNIKDNPRGGKNITFDTEGGIPVIIMAGLPLENKETSFDLTHVSTHERAHGIVDLVVGRGFSYSTNELATELIAEAMLLADGNYIDNPSTIVAASGLNDVVHTLSIEILPKKRELDEKVYDATKKRILRTIELLDVYSSELKSPELAALPDVLQDQKRYLGLAALQELNEQQQEETFSSFIQEAIDLRKALTIWNRAVSDHRFGEETPLLNDVFGFEQTGREEIHYSLGYFAKQGIAYMEKQGIDAKVKMAGLPKLKKTKKYKQAEWIIAKSDDDLKKGKLSDIRDFYAWKDSLIIELPGLKRRAEALIEKYDLRNKSDEARGQYGYLEDDGALYKIEKDSSSRTSISIYGYDKGKGTILDRYVLGDEDFFVEQYKLDSRKQEMIGTHITQESIPTQIDFETLQEAKSAVMAILKKAEGGLLRKIRLNKRERKQRIDEFKQKAA